MDVLLHLSWTLAVTFACVSCFFGVRRDEFAWAWMAGAAAAALALNSAHEMQQMLRVMEGSSRDIRVNLEVLLGMALWIYRLPKWVS